MHKIVGSKGSADIQEKQPCEHHDRYGKREADRDVRETIEPEHGAYGVAIDDIEFAWKMILCHGCALSPLCLSLLTVVIQRHRYFIVENEMPLCNIPNFA